MDINSKLRKVVDKIATEIKKVRQGKFDTSYADIVNYMLGQGEWRFDDYNERDLVRTELIGDLSDEAFRRITKWCFEKL